MMSVAPWLWVRGHRWRHHHHGEGLRAKLTDMPIWRARASRARLDYSLPFALRSPLTHTSFALLLLAGLTPCVTTHSPRLRAAAQSCAHASQSATHSSGADNHHTNNLQLFQKIGFRTIGAHMAATDLMTSAFCREFRCAPNGTSPGPQNAKISEKKV